MASEPPSIRHDPLDTSARLKSAPPISDAATKTPAVNVGTGTSGTPAEEAVGQQSGSDERANDRLSVASGHDDKQTSETAVANAERDPTPTVVKAEPDSGASMPENIPSIPSDKVYEKQATTLKEEAGTAADSDSNPQQKPNNITLDNLQKLADETDLVKLEAGVDETLAILDTLQAPLSDSKQTKQLEWLATINKLKQQSKRTRTVVAVVGETGAGKTSLINALLDEDKLLVTSGWRACTAVICEISYNEIDDPQKAYRAEVEFISQESWESEAQILFGDLVEDNHLSSMKSDGKTEAGIAYAKIKAVYPDLTDTMIVQHTAKSLTKRESVAEVLGTTRRINCRTASDLSSAIQKYLDSKEKSTKTGPKKEEDMAFWPLIKVVRIFCRSEALSSGLVVVDLPGVADSNPARSAVASRYMTECTAVWVAAPIKRATDNKVAKELMGKSSRLQMKLDGIYSNVTFICTMTDAIEFAEAIDAFDQDGQIQAANSREDEAQSSIKEKDECLKRLEIQMQHSELICNELDRELKVWEGLRKKHQKGHTVYPPHVPSKRKRPTRSQRSRRRQEVIDEDEDEDKEVEETPLTANDISAKLEDLETRYGTADNDLAEMEKQQEALKEELINLEEKRNNAAVDAARLCVCKRNDVVKKAIRADFAAGVQEIDDEEAQHDENYDPSVERRDYGVVASSLPVFTISAKAYQQICRPKKRDTPVAGFRTLLDTEIPQLVEHALKLPEKGRIAARRTFINQAAQLLNSLTIWCTAGDTDLGSAQMTAEEKTYEMQYLKIAISNLQKKLNHAITIQNKEMESIVSEEIEKKFTNASKHAAKVIAGLVEKWPLKEDVGGRDIRFHTYRSSCRHGGERTKAAKSFNFNEAILEPYLGKIATGWEQAFLRSIPSSLDKFVTTFTDTLRAFHSMMAARPELQKCKKSSMRIFSQQLDIHSKSIEATIESMKADIQGEQRQASRMFPPEIKTEMKKVYDLCKAEKGPGCFLRIKAHMMNHINKQKHSMYRKATKRVLKELMDMFETNRQEMEDSTHTIITGLQKDFEMILSNSEMLEASEVARDHIRGVLQGVDARFVSILSGEPMEVNTVQPPVCQPQQPPDMSMAGVEAAPGEAAETVATETVPLVEGVAMDTTQ